ncbi:hypothetical protein R1flu_017135 [Riccia fluitans]|uniref:Uncharacterized protein n=1 Tax=Riccia fluitans TaxID=41844 RepID=A0ABD1YNU0_9MARC
MYIDGLFFGRYNKVGLPLALLPLPKVAVRKQLAVACCGQASNPLYSNGGGSSGASDARFWVNSSLVPKEKNRQICFQFCSSKRRTGTSGGISLNSASSSANNGVDVEGFRSKFEALLYCGKSVPEEKIEKPTGLPAQALPVGNKPKCLVCEAKGAVVCATCAGTGLYVDAILESQGIIVRVRCLGCGGSGSTMCPKCWGRGHV